MQTGGPSRAQAPQESERVWSCVPAVLGQASPAHSPGGLQLSAQPGPESLPTETPRGAVGWGQTDRWGSL